MMLTSLRAEVPDSEPVSERSFGIIPIKVIQTAIPPESASFKVTSANTQVLLIQQRPRASAHTPFWSFPKGHAECGDRSEIHSAIRELREETGLIVKEDGVMFKDAEGLTERYRNPVRGWVKEVRYWLGVVDDQGSSRFELQEAELVDARWLFWVDALDLATFPKGKLLLKRAMELLDTSAPGESESSNLESLTNEIRPSTKL